MSQKEFNWDGATITTIELRPTSQSIMVMLYVPIESERDLTLAEAASLIDKAKFKVRLVEVEGE